MDLRHKLPGNWSVILSVLLVLIIAVQYYLVMFMQDNFHRNFEERYIHGTQAPKHHHSVPNAAPKLSHTITKHYHHLAKNNTMYRQVQLDSSKYRKQPFDVYSPNCTALVFDKTLNVKNTTFPFKMYVYDLPKELNVETAKCAMQRDLCFDISNCGIGELLHRDYDLNVHSTWQFALETIIHNKLMFSIHRTLDPDEADIFYVPYYGAMACFCYDRYDGALEKEIAKNMQSLINFLNNSTHFLKGKPHLLTVSKIEREQASPTRCPLLQKLKSPNVRYIGIEQESDPHHRKDNMGLTNEMIVAPYPSYGHLHALKNGFYEKIIFTQRRKIFLFLAASSRRSNTFRAQILDQFQYTKTLAGPEDHFRLKRLQNTSQVDAIWLITRECQGKHKHYTLDYMKLSIFCLQPAGDSPTRKSFYDGLISGCIPVLFKERHPVKWAFHNHIPYENITITLSPSVVNSRRSILKELRKIPDYKIATMQTLIAKYVKYFQYSSPPSNLPHDDAIELILREAAEAFRLNKT